MHTILFLLLNSAAPVDTTREAAVRKELAGLQGVWIPKSMDYGPGPNVAKAEPFPEQWSLVISDTSFAFQCYAGTLKPNPAAKPHALDLVVKHGSAEGVMILACYELKSDSLRVVMPSGQRPNERPVGFAVLEGVGHTLWTFERDKKVRKEDYTLRLASAKDKIIKDAAKSPAVAGPMTLEMLQKVIDRLDRLDRRLDEIEKRLPSTKK